MFYRNLLYSLIICLLICACDKRRDVLLGNWERDTIQTLDSVNESIVDWDSERRHEMQLIYAEVASFEFGRYFVKIDDGNELNGWHAARTINYSILESLSDLIIIQLHQQPPRGDEYMELNFIDDQKFWIDVGGGMKDFYKKKK